MISFVKVIKFSVASLAGTPFRNSFMNETPTGKEVQLNGISIYKIKDNQVIKDWYAPDELNFLIQLGIIPPVTPPNDT